ncbi:MAG: phosphoglucosamine mutase [Candidatus Cloacimonetes bacterium]|nr:phosphoglucosamine mutase [Candidatus Cloacimonadota bacterium]
MKGLMKSVSGVRGVCGSGLTPEIAMRFAAHFGVMQKRGTIVVGRDSRTTGPAMLHAVCAGLISVGCDVIDIGIAATPTVLLAVEDLEAQGGIAITASHNPAQWNAMKFCDANGLFLFPEKAAEFIAKTDSVPNYVGWDKIGNLYKDLDATIRHIRKILNIPYLELKQIRAKKFKVVIDCVNGAGGVIAPALLHELDCEVIEINSDPTGKFAHSPEPLKENLTELTAKVKKFKADIGFATDPDVDRLAIVDEHGEYIGEEFSLLLAEKYVLGKHKGDIVTNLSSSMASEDIAREFGVAVHRTKVGEINVGIAMMENNSPIGGEGNGGIIIPEVHYTRDAPAGMAVILAALAESDKSVSQLVNEIPRYHFAKLKLEAKDQIQLDTYMQNAERIFANEKSDRTDGLKILGDKFWIHIRKSGTEPIIRVYTEAETSKKAMEIAGDTIKKIIL